MKLCALAILLAVSAAAQTPALRGETLDGRKFTLSEAGAGKTTLLILGFSKKAGDLSAAWRERFTSDFGGNPASSWLVVAFLEDAPSLLRGIIKSGMRGGTPQAQRSHVIVTTSDQAVWKKFVRLTDDNLPSVLLLDGAGQVKWSWNGAFEASHYADLKQTVSALLSK